MTESEKEQRMKEVMNAIEAGDWDLATILYAKIIFDLICKVIFETKYSYEKRYDSILEGDDNAE